MVKNGDDVRQDQMVIQMIRLMNKLLNDMNLDLCLSPYSVLAIRYLFHHFSHQVLPKVYWKWCRTARLCLESNRSARS